MTTLLTISQVSLESGIAKEVLRKWETRYGFPIPLRDANGNRIYTHQQLNHLKLIRKLLDNGLRPAQIVPMPESELNVLASKNQEFDESAEGAQAFSPIIEWLKLRQPNLLQEKLRSEINNVGLSKFVQELMPLMNMHVGQAWEKGEIAVRDEHVYTEIINGLIRESLASRINPEGRPFILLATPPGEAHGLGILMLQSVLTCEGANCISMGLQAPIEEISSAAIDFHADIVGISFSTAFPKKTIVPALKEIRARLPAHIKLWAGGSGINGIERIPRGVNFVYTFDEVIQLVRQYRSTI
jgi:DNA-binding transcriptional MerR regulator/methylmalonyl-CoA mutase cobalamin-binding subunit